MISEKVNQEGEVKRVTRLVRREKKSLEERFVENGSSTTTTVVATVYSGLCTGQRSDDRVRWV